MEIPILGLYIQIEDIGFGQRTQSLHFGILQLATPAVPITESKSLGKLWWHLGLILEIKLFGKKNHGNQHLCHSHSSIHFQYDTWSDTHLESVNRRLKIILEKLRTIWEDKRCLISERCTL